MQTLKAHCTCGSHWKLLSRGQELLATAQPWNIVNNKLVLLSLAAGTISCVE